MKSVEIHFDRVIIVFNPCRKEVDPHEKETHYRRNHSAGLIRRFPAGDALRPCMAGCHLLGSHDL